MRLAARQIEAPAPQARGPDARAPYDIAFFLSFLVENRSVTYEPLSVPGARHESSAVQTFLLNEAGRDKRLALERLELTATHFEEARARLESRGSIVKSSSFQLHKRDFAILLEEALATILGKSHLLAVSADERVLLIRNRLTGVDETTFLWAPISTPERSCIDHLYLIVRGRLLECW